MGRTAGEAGWRVSRYNLAARIPDSDKIAVANLFRGTCCACTPVEMFLLDELESLDEDHPILDYFRRRGLIVNYDEREALSALARMGCTMNPVVALTICPTMGCNFDCPYCFENHRAGRMSQETQDDVVALAERMLRSSGAKKVMVCWFGGEPLLMPEIIESLSARLMALAEKRGAEYSATIVTNGYLLTQEIADMLGRCRVDRAQITLDGVGPEHDRTRHLAGGGPTYGRIVENLRTLRLPFRVYVRHNVHEGNRDQMEPLRNVVSALSKESGNKLKYYASPVNDNTVAQERNAEGGLFCADGPVEVGMHREAEAFGSARSLFCGANRLYALGIDDQGRLFKCWEDVDKADRSFASAHEWDPANPIFTADRPDLLSRYLNCAPHLEDPECNECVFLPQCAGGCPTRRLFYRRTCLRARNMPERFVLELYEQLQRKNKKKEEQKGETT